MRPRITAARRAAAFALGLGGVMALAACDMPELPAAASDAPYPALAPLDPLMATVAPPTMDAADQAALQARAERLRVRAAALRQR